ncbi:MULTISPECIES: GntR family transcriptional regulator [Burkholderiales]|nr:MULTISPECIES: GntR family transcriptional regulator [Burkholderiales]
MEPTSDKTVRRPLRHQPMARAPTLVARVTEHVRRCIVEGEWKLGEYISEERIASSIEVSRTPVREALTALQMQGLVTIQPQRGTFVFLPTQEEVVVLCEFRKIMECQAMSLCMEKSAAATLAALRAANVEMQAAAARGDRLTYGKSDADFHNVFFDNCGNRFFAEAYYLMSGRFDALRNFLSGNLSRANPSPADEHEDIIDAFASGKLEDTQALLSSHVLAMSGRFATAMASGASPPQT